MNDKPFQIRSNMGEAFAEAVFSLLRDQRLIAHVTRAGIERTDLARVMDAIRKSDDPMARRLRFNPDGAVLTARGLSHWEAKASIFIEKTPYEFYMQYEESGEPVLLFISPNLAKRGFGSVFVGRVRDLILEHGSEYEEQFPNPRPVCSDGWIYPRRDITGIRIPQYGPQGSGTPCRRIDIRKSGMLRISTNATLTQTPGGQLFSSAIALDLLVADTVERQVNSNWQSLGEVCARVVQQLRPKESSR